MIKENVKTVISIGLLVTFMATIIWIGLFVLEPNSQTPQPLFGDINNDRVVNDEDIYYIKGHLLNRWELTKEEYYRADMNQDGNLSSLDVVLIKMKILGIEKPEVNIVVADTMSVTTQTFPPQGYDKNTQPVIGGER